MTEWIANHIALFLAEGGKVSDILAALVVVQCVTFLLIFGIWITLPGKVDKESK